MNNNSETNAMLVDPSDEQVDGVAGAGLFDFKLIDLPGHASPSNNALRANGVGVRLPNTVLLLHQRSRRGHWLEPSRARKWYNMAHVDAAQRACRTRPCAP